MYTPNDVSVIICAFTEQRWHDLCDAVESLQRQDSPPREIVVVIDHNPAMLAKAREAFPGVIVVENAHGQGASGSRNSGVAASSGSLIAFLDDDAVAFPDWVEQCCAAYQADPDGKVLGVGGHVQSQWADKRPAWFPEEFDWVVGGSYKGGPVTATAVRNVWSNNMSIRREVFEAIDGFGLGFGKTGARSRPEDTDLCIRALQKFPQGTWLYKPEIKIFHKVPRNRARWGYFVWRCYNEGVGKADLGARVGVQDSTHTERQYALRALPPGVARGVADTLLRGDLSGVTRSGAIVTGFTLTALGYVAGRLKQHPLAASFAR